MNQLIQLSPDAVAEYRTATNNYSAEYGRASGAVVNVSVKSGTNAFHGGMWEFLSNTELNAVGFFQPLGGVKPVYRQNQFGATLGGRVIKDKLFFFVDYEGQRRNVGALQFATLPSSGADRQLRQGGSKRPSRPRHPRAGGAVLFASPGSMAASRPSASACPACLRQTASADSPRIR